MKPVFSQINQPLRSVALAMILLLACLRLQQAMAADHSPEELWVPPSTFQSIPTITPQKLSPHLRAGAKQRKNQKRFMLEQLNDRQFKLKSAQTDRGRTKAGFTRDIPEFQTKEQTLGQLDWETSADGGLISLLSFSSPSALALRLGLKIYNLSDGVELRFFSNQSNEGDVVTGAEIMASVRKNLEAGDPEETARIYWSPAENGETIGLEIYLPPGTYPEQVEISIPQLTHIFLSPGAGFDPYALQTTNVDGSIKASGACNVDVRCQWPTWQDRSNAVGQMTFNDGGSYYICTGTLLNDTISSGTPYFLSANHCISTQTVASSLQTKWFYYSTACNSGITNPNNRTISGGADLLYQSIVTDTSFMRLRSAPPTGTTYSGWTTSKQAISTLSSGLHNPGGDLQKFSSGQVSNYWDCTPTTSGSFTCSSNADGNFANIIWSSGTTEGGSSGSGIFTNSGQYLFGQLYGGNSSCSNLSGSNFYGRFDKAYVSGNLGQWLANQYSLSVSKTGTGIGAVTSSPAGINCGTSCSANFSSASNVRLTATPVSGSNFANWSGCTSTSGTTCDVTMTATKSVTANFALNPIREGIAGVSSTGQIWYTRDLVTWARATGELAQVDAGSFEGLIGTTSMGAVWYTTNLSAWTAYSGTLKQVIAADLNGDGNDDVVGVNFSGEIWYNLGQGWVKIPGTLKQLAAGDVNGDGLDDIVGVNPQGSIWYTTNRNTWTRIPGELSQVAVGDISGDARADVAGVSTNGTVWYTSNLNNWTPISANLTQIDIGDLNGDGLGDIAGLSPSGAIWYTTNISAWTPVSGQLAQITLGRL